MHTRNEASFEFPDRESIDRLWAQEAEDRIDPYEWGDVTASPAALVLGKINR